MKSPADADKLIAENFQLKTDLSEKILENDQLKTSLSERVVRHNKLCDDTKNILNIYKSFSQSLQKLPIIDDSVAIKNIMDKREYEKLLSYNFFDVEFLFININKALFDKIENEIMKHIIDNCLDLNTQVNYVGYISTRLIHSFCKNANDELIQYLINKGVELECPDLCGYYPLHLICVHSTYSMIKYIIGKGVNTKSNPKIDLVEIINQRSYSFTSGEKIELIALIE